MLSGMGIQLIIWQAVFTVFITLILFLRFWAARIKRRALRPDDYLVVLAYISTLILQACTCWGIANGLGAHTVDVTPAELQVQQKILISNGITWLFATVSCKVAILYFYTVIFSTGRFLIAARALMCVCVAYGISFFVAFLTNCQPIEHFWAPVPGGHCKDITIEEVTSVSLNMALDIAIVLWPLPPLWKLQMPTAKKVAISALFSLGLMVTGIMAWRNYLQVQPINKLDYVYAAGIIGLPNFLELWLGIIVACLPTLTPLYSKYLKPAYSTMRGNSYDTESVSGGGRGSGGRKDVKRTFGSYVPRGRKKPRLDYWDEVSYLDMEEGKATYSSSSDDYKESFPSAPAPSVPKGPSGCRRSQKSLPETPKIRYSEVFDSRAIQVRSDVTVFSEPGKW